MVSHLSGLNIRCDMRGSSSSDADNRSQFITLKTPLHRGRAHIWKSRLALSTPARDSVACATVLGADRLRIPVWRHRPGDEPLPGRQVPERYESRSRIGRALAC